MQQTTGGSAAGPVVGRAHQAYDLEVDINFVPARDFPKLRPLGCQPRDRGLRSDVEALPLPSATVDFLLGANKHIIDWLARDTANQKAFVADPVAGFTAALREAGVEMDRSHVKAIARARATVGASEVVAPGLQMRRVTTAVNKKGRVPQEKPERSWNPPRLEGDDCGCEKKVED